MNERRLLDPCVGEGGWERVMGRKYGEDAWVEGESAEMAGGGSVVGGCSMVVVVGEDSTDESVE